MGWFGGDNKARPKTTTLNGIPITAPEFQGPAGLAHAQSLAAANKAAYDDRTNPPPTPPTISDPGTNQATAASAAERTRKRASAGSTYLTPGTSGTAARALLAPRTLVGGGS